MKRKSEIFFVFTVILCFAVLASWDLGSWYYSIIGDEYAFYFYALDILHKGIPHWSLLLSQHGVYGEHPVLSSIPQVIFLKLFGEWNVVWRFSSVCTLVLSFPALFYWAKRWYGRQVAVFATLFYASSHYLLAYAHTGYNNIQAILFPLYTVFLLSQKKFFYTAALLAGLGGGLSFYTFYSARITVFIGILTFLVLWREKHHAKHQILYGFLLYISGFFMLFLPFIWKNGADTFAQMYQNTYLAPRFTTMVGNVSPVQHFLSNFRINFLSFLSNPSTVKHYVSGPLVDRLTAMFVLGGYGVILYHFKKAKYAFIGLVIVGIVAIAGGLYAVREIVTSRLYIVVPFWCVSAGLCMHTLYHATQKRVNKFLLNGIVIAMFLSVLGLNMYIFYNVTPRVTYTGPEPLYIKVLQENKSSTILIVEDEYRSTFHAIAGSYGLFYTPATLEQFRGLYVVKPLTVIDRTNEKVVDAILREKGIAFDLRRTVDLGGHFVEYFNVRM